MPLSLFRGLPVQSLVGYNIRMGRHSILDKDLTVRFAKEVREGLPVSYVCDLFKIWRDTYQYWMKRGEEDMMRDVESAYADFYLEVKSAYADFVKDSRNVIRKGGPGWQGAAWWLERVDKNFMPKQQIQGDDEGKVTVVIGGRPKDLKPKRLDPEGE